MTHENVPFNLTRLQQAAEHVKQLIAVIDPTEPDAFYVLPYMQGLMPLFDDILAGNITIPLTDPSPLGNILKATDGAICRYPELEKALLELVNALVSRPDNKKLVATEGLEPPVKGL